jgi:hypothetical protein
MFFSPKSSELKSHHEGTKNTKKGKYNYSVDTLGVEGFCRAGG